PSLPLLGTASPAQTAKSLRLFATYAATYVLAVNLVRTRSALDRPVSVLLVLGSGLAFLALLDFLSGGGPRLVRWTEPVPGHRLAGTFVNPDQFAAWLEMLIGLGVGYVIGRSGSAGGEPSLRAALASRAGRERLARRWLPMVGLGVMGLALVFTLSRGGVVSMAVALVALLILQGVRRRARASLVVVGSLLALTVGYGAWIGFSPLLERFPSQDSGGRLVQLGSTVRMPGAFPLLSVGLGAYRDVYFRYQPLELAPGKVYFPFAHNDLVQLAVELGLVGAALCLFAAWRVGADLVGAHLL